MEPALKLLAGIVNVTLPDASACAEEVYPPPESVTLPVAVPRPPATVTGTLRLWPELIAFSAGLTVTVGNGAAVTITAPTPVVEAYVESPL